MSEPAQYSIALHQMGAASSWAYPTFIPTAEGGVMTFNSSRAPEYVARQSLAAFTLTFTSSTNNSFYSLTIGGTYSQAEVQALRNMCGLLLEQVASLRAAVIALKLGV